MAPERPAGAVPVPALTVLLLRHWWRPDRSVLAQCLRPLSWLYRGLAWLHQRTVQPVNLPVPVIVVGNLIVGGAGKTPTTLALLQALRDAGLKPGVVSRGYGRQGDQPVVVNRELAATTCGDEPLLIHLRSGAPVQVDFDRVRAVQQLLARAPDVNVVVSDDGLQHARLKRDLQILVFDERGVGNGLCLPAGPLRQPMGRRVPERSLVLYNAPQPSTPWPGFLAHRALAGAVSLADWWQGAPPSEDTLLRLVQGSHAQPVLAVAGLAAPERFFGMLEGLGMTIDRLPQADHAALQPLPWPGTTVTVVLTEKDAVKLRPECLGQTQVWVVALDFRLTPPFLQALHQALQPWTSVSP
jgi:tetraacyldisaccharide 4'-kinase